MTHWALFMYTKVINFTNNVDTRLSLMLNNTHAYKNIIHGGEKV